LNAPTFWKFSHLKKSVAPTAASIERQRSTGVRCTWGAIRSCAARIAARSGSSSARIFGMEIPLETNLCARIRSSATAKYKPRRAEAGDQALS
jgi:hypothetical protein